MHGPVPNGNYAYGISGNNTVGLYYWNAPVNGVKWLFRFFSTMAALIRPLSGPAQHFQPRPKAIDGNNIVDTIKTALLILRFSLQWQALIRPWLTPLGTKTYAYGISGKQHRRASIWISSFNHYGFL